MSFCLDSGQFLENVIFGRFPENVILSKNPQLSISTDGSKKPMSNRVNRERQKFLLSSVSEFRPVKGARGSRKSAN